MMVWIEPVLFCTPHVYVVDLSFCLWYPDDVDKYKMSCTLLRNTNEK
jgi:hypothetical protein